MTQRHADEVTIQHIIELRREIQRLEKLVTQYQRQADNASDVAMKLYIENRCLKENHGSDITDK
jgi:hypothetical protein